MTKHFGPTCGHILKTSDSRLPLGTEYINHKNCHITLYPSVPNIKLEHRGLWNIVNFFLYPSELKHGFEHNKSEVCYFVMPNVHIDTPDIGFMWAIKIMTSIKVMINYSKVINDKVKQVFFCCRKSDVDILIDNLQMGKILFDVHGAWIAGYNSSSIDLQQKLILDLYISAVEMVDF